MDFNYKQVIVVRKDLSLSAGKLAVQVAHASLGAYRKVDKEILKEWETEGEKKVVLQVASEKELMELLQTAKDMKFPCALIRDAGLTEIPPGTVTALGIGPDRSEDLDNITGDLPLLS